MKKFFALMLSVAMLLVAGSAMAADPTITASPATVSVQRGSTATVTVTATAGHPGGTMGTVSVRGIPWATVSGTTITFAPAETVEAGTYTAVATVAETYTPSGAAGHSGAVEAIASTPITVTVTRPAGTFIETVITSVVTVVKKVVTVVSSTVQQATTYMSFEKTTRTTVEIFKDTSSAEDPALAARWAAKAEATAASLDAAKADLVSPAKRASTFPGLSANADTTPRTNDKLKKAENSSAAAGATQAQRLAAAAAVISEDGAAALSASDAVEPEEPGTYSFGHNFKKGLFKTKIKGHNGAKGKKRATVVGTFYAAAADNTGVAFTNSAGDLIDEIPGDDSPDQIMPGFVNMLVVMESGEVYEPIIYATADDLKAASIAVSETSADVQEVTYVEETKTVVVDETGKTTETVITTASADVVSKLATAMGATSIRLVPVAKAAEVPTATIKVDDEAATAANKFVATRMPAFNDLDAGAYYYPVTFKSLGLGVNTSGDFEFYPDGYSASTIAFAMVFDENGNEVTPSILSATEEKKGYIAFEILSSGLIKINAADADNTLANPTLTVGLTAVTPTPTPTSEDAVIADLRDNKKYINANNVLTNAAYLSGSKPTFTTSGDLYIMNIALKSDFTVDNWSATCGGTALTASAITGSIKKTSDTSATVQIDRTTLPSGNSSVVVSMHPTNANTTSRVTDTWTVSYASPTGDVGVGSSSGGCSAGSAALALAVLGAFIATRKK